MASAPLFKNIIFIKTRMVGLYYLFELKIDPGCKVFPKTVLSMDVGGIPIMCDQQGTVC